MLNVLEKLKEAKLVNSRKHPTAPLTIWNYTKTAQFSRAWDDVTRAARGLILREDGTIHGRGFLKFFNYGEENIPLPTCRFKILDKVDGSMAILHFVNGEPEIATRGSFDGGQALRGTEIFRRKYKGYKPPEGTTAVFELVYKENRIVCNYGDTEDLFHLGLVDNATGLVRFDLDENWPGPKVKEFPPMPLDELSKQVRPNAEGFVIRYENGYQLKVKLADYLRLHKVMFGTSTRSIWEALMSGKGMEELLDNAPDEAYSFIRDHIYGLNSKFQLLENQARAEFNRICCLPTRKEFAEEAKKHQFSSVLFAMLDNKDYNNIIWKMIEPVWVSCRAVPGEDEA